MKDIQIYHHTPPGLEDHPLFSGKTSVGILATGKPVMKPQIAGEDEALHPILKASGLVSEKTTGHYFGPEPTRIIYGPSRQQMYDLGKAFGQESVVFSAGGHHELLYTNGPNDGKAHPGLKEVGFDPKTPPPDYWTHLPGKGYIRLLFDQNTLRPVPLALKKSEGYGTPTSIQSVPGWAGAYPWHETHTSHNHRGNVGGILVDPASFPLSKADTSHPHIQAHGPTPPDFSGGKAVFGNEQSGVAGTSKAYGRFAAPYGNIDKSSPSTLKFYPLEGKSDAADATVKAHGYQTYYAGGRHGKPDLAGKNYNTGHLMVYDPEAGGGGDFYDTSYTDAWRKTHELAHALTYPEINQKYGEGRRMGSLGTHRTAREAKRAVEWEWLAVHKQRDLAAGMGVHIPDEDFHRELNTVMHDAMHRAVTGKFTDPSKEGFRPHPHKVPLATAMSLIDEASQQLGLKHEHDLLKKSEFVSVQNNNLSGYKGITEMIKKEDSFVTKKEVALGVAAAIRNAMVKHEAVIKSISNDLRKGTGAPPPGGMPSPGVGSAVPGPMGKEEMDKCGEISHKQMDKSCLNCGMTKDEPSGVGMQCPGCGGSKHTDVGSIGDRHHHICHGCSMSFSTPIEENQAPSHPDPAVGTARKAEMCDIGTVDETGPKVPKSKTVKAPGSGGDIKKSLRKDASNVVISPSKKMSPPGLPGMTPPSGKVGSGKPDISGAKTLLDLKPAGLDTSKLPTLAFPGRPKPFVKKPSADDPIPPKPVDNSEISHAEKRAAGIGFLSNLISKFRGAGNKTWEDLRGAGPSSAGRVARTGAARMALGEKSPIDKATPEETNKELKGFKSLASNPTAMPSFPGIKSPKPPVAKADLDMEKAAIPSAPKPPAAPKPAKPAVSAPTGPSTGPQPSTGPAKPKAAPATAMKSEKNPKK